MGATLAAVGLLVSTAVFVGHGTGQAVRRTLPTASATPSSSAGPLPTVTAPGVTAPELAGPLSTPGAMVANAYASLRPPPSNRSLVRRPSASDHRRSRPRRLPRGIPLSDVPKPWPVPAHTPDLTAISGKGMWLTTWKTSHVDVPTVVAQAKAAGLTSLWVRTGGSKQGYYGDPLLHALLRAAHAAGLKVIAWDFPAMSNPATGRDPGASRAEVQGRRPADRRLQPGHRDDQRGHVQQPQAGLLLPLPRTAGSRGRPVVATVMRPTTCSCRPIPTLPRPRTSMLSRRWTTGPATSREPWRRARSRRWRSSASR